MAGDCGGHPGAPGCRRPIRAAARTRRAEAPRFAGARAGARDGAVVGAGARRRHLGARSGTSQATRCERAGAPRRERVARIVADRTPARTGADRRIRIAEPNDTRTGRGGGAARRQRRGGRVGHPSTLGTDELKSLTTAAGRVLDQLRRVVLGQDAALREAISRYSRAATYCWRARRGRRRPCSCARSAAPWGSIFAASNSLRTSCLRTSPA